MERSGRGTGLLKGEPQSASDPRVAAEPVKGAPEGARCKKDVTDAVAEALQQPVATLSLEMVYRGLYHFTQAFHRGAANDPVTYLAEDARGLGIVKQKRKPPTRDWPAFSVAANP